MVVYKQYGQYTTSTGLVGICIGSFQAKEITTPFLRSIIPDQSLLVKEVILL
ncbi:hypothetical protein FLA_0462 [Filimonas lacunae]|nr:hypothetical protein FLA_0462 [Filimonas lacunae]